MKKFIENAVNWFEGLDLLSRSLIKTTFVMIIGLICLLILIKWPIIVLPIFGFLFVFTLIFFVVYAFES